MNLENAPLNNNCEFTLSNYEKIYENILKFSEENNYNHLIESIRQFTEYQIWGEANNESFFEFYITYFKYFYNFPLISFFCEKCFLKKLFQITQKISNRAVIIQIIQSLGILFFNIEKPTHLNFLLSNNLINDFISFSFDFNDEEIVDYYISFLKSLALKIPFIPIEFFLNEKCLDFPLLTRAVRFYNHKENMVRASVRNITLSIFKCKDVKINEFICHFPFALYFFHLSCYLKDLWIDMDNIIIHEKEKKESKLQQKLEWNVDILIYFSDIFRLDIPELNLLISNCLFVYAIVPGILHSFTYQKKGTINISFALYLLQTIFQNIEHIPLLETLALCLFGEYIDKRIQNLIKTQGELPISYNYTWRLTNCWDEVPDFIYQKYQENFKPGLKNNENKDKLKNDSFEEIVPEEDFIKSHHARYANFIEKIGNFKNKLALTSNNLINYLYTKKTIDFHKEYSVIYKMIVSSINAINDNQNNPELSFPTLIRNTVDNLHGFNKELNQMPKNTKFIALEEKNMFFKRNEFSEILKSFLHSKDDNLILMTCGLIYTIFLKDNFNYEILKFCGLLKPNLGFSTRDSFNNSSIDQIKKSCLKLLPIDPPFSFLTFKILTKLIFLLSKNKEGKLAFDKEDFDLIKESYVYFISKMYSLLKYAEMVVEIFEQEWNIIKNYDFDSIIEFSFQDIIFSSLQKSELSTELKIKRDVDCFFLFFSLIKKLFGPKSVVENIDFVSQIYYEFNAEYQININTGIIEGIDFDKLTICFVNSKDKNHSFLLENPCYFIILDELSERNGKILHACKHKHVNFTFNDEKSIIFAGFSLANNSIFDKRRKIVDLEIEFENNDKYQGIKEMITQSKTDQVKTEGVLISKILDYCEKEIERITGISLE